MSYVRENDSTQNAHIKHSNDSRQKPTWKHIGTIRRMRDSSICRIMGKGQSMIKGRKVYDPLTDTWSTGYWVADDKGNYYPVW